MNFNFAFIAFVLCFSPALLAGSNNGLCSDKETTYFGCVTAKQRWIALCGAVPQTLQYRYGKEGKVELRFPENAVEGKDRLKLAHYMRFQTDRTEVSFQNQNVDYAIFDYVENNTRTAGVRVTTADGKDIDIVCKGKITSHLSDLKTALPCDTDNALNGGQCP